MKITLAGDWHSELHEKIVERSLKVLGHEVYPFKWNQYFTSSILSRFQNKYLLGPTVNRINDDLIQFVICTNPQILFVYRGTHVYPSTIRKIKQYNPEIIVVGYNNDDPFSIHCPRWIWRHFINSLRFYDVMFAYREKNVSEFIKAGAKKTFILRSWFDKKRNFPLELNSNELKKYECDVTFIGHFEQDGRLEYLEEVVKRGWKLKLYGPGYEWNDIISKSRYLKNLAPINLIWGEDYNLAINGAKIALCFLSKLNNDTYTRRCFEIPASGTMLMSERTEDLKSLFLENEEAIFFSNLSEFGCKLDMLLRNKKEINRISRNGHEKVITCGHDIDSRMRFLIDKIASNGAKN